MADGDDDQGEAFEELQQQANNLAAATGRNDLVERWMTTAPLPPVVKLRFNIEPGEPHKTTAVTKASFSGGIVARRRQGDDWSIPVRIRIATDLNVQSPGQPGAYEV